MQDEPAAPTGQHTMSGEEPLQANEFLMGQREEDHIGRLGHGLRQAGNLPQRRGKAGGAGVIRRQLRHVPVQRVGCSGREHTRLAQPATQHLAPSPRLVDQRAAAAQGGANRRTQTLGKTHRHRIEGTRDGADRHRERYRRIEQPGTVQVPRQPVVTAQLRIFREIGQGQRHAGHRVFQAHEPGPREVHVVRFDGRANRAQRQRAIGRERHRLRLHTTQHGAAAALEQVGVRIAAGDVFVAALTVTQDRQQIALRAAAHEQRCLET